MTQANEIKLSEGIAYALKTLHEKAQAIDAQAQALVAERQAVNGAVATILAPVLPPGDQPTDWLIRVNQDQSISLVKQQPPSIPSPATAAPMPADAQSGTPDAPNLA